MAEIRYLNLAHGSETDLNQPRSWNVWIALGLYQPLLLVRPSEAGLLVAINRADRDWTSRGPGHWTIASVKRCNQYYECLESSKT
jgi:hypothetical protein